MYILPPQKGKFYVMYILPPNFYHWKLRGIFCWLTAELWSGGSNKKLAEW